MLTPAIILNSSPATWGPEPMPADAMLILPGLALAYAMNSGTVFGRNRWIDLQDEWSADHPRDRRDVAEKNKIQLGIERRVDRAGWRGQQERIAICGRTHDRFGTNIGARARPVLDNEWLAQPLGQPLTHQTGDEVGVAGGGERHDHPNRARRIGLRPCDSRHSRQRGSARCQMEKISAGKFHFEPSSLHIIRSPRSS